jgi:hypothetical protein
MKKNFTHTICCLFLFIGFSLVSKAQRINEQPIKVVQCYPNPANTIITFEFGKNSDKNTLLCIYNFIGKRVEEIRVNNSRVIVNLNQYFRGLYFYQLKNREGRVLESGKFQVVK